MRRIAVSVSWIFAGLLAAGCDGSQFVPPNAEIATERSAGMLSAEEFQKRLETELPIGTPWPDVRAFIVWEGDWYLPHGLPRRCATDRNCERRIIAEFRLATDDPVFCMPVMSVTFRFDYLERLSDLETTTHCGFTYQLAD